MNTRTAEADLVVVSNRLPVDRATEGEEWRRSPGGLVAALEPVLGSHHMILIVSDVDVVRSERF